MNSKGPLLIAANHPNSFLDAILIATLFKRPVYSLTRGDVYKNNFFRWVLNALKMLPVYRISEGAKNLEHNYSTFEKCREIFKKNGIVLIFSEGRCINEWELRKLKKGTARLTISSWQEGIPLTVLPTGINYSSFKKFGKNIIVSFGDLIHEHDIDLSASEGNAITSFNEKLKEQLQRLVIQIDKRDQEKIRKTFYVSISPLTRSLLLVPAVLGYFIHLIPYLIIKLTLGKKFRNNDHYDSVMVAGMFLIYPFFLSFCAILLYTLHFPYWWLALPLIPFTGWSYVQLKKQF